MLNFFKKKEKKADTSQHPEKVRAFYNKHNDSFLKVYGDVIQAFRTTDVSIYLDYTIESAGLEEGQHILDAGCGVAVPATYFAGKVPNLKVDALTVSEVQAGQAKEKVEQKGLTDKVTVTRGDYHQMDEIYGKEQFDAILFLESFGHSTDKVKLLNAAWNCLKPGGFVYIKDLFRRIGFDEELQGKIDEEIRKINEAYHYEVAELSSLVDESRKIGFAIEFIKTIDIDLNEFENLTISNDFQELTGIARIEDWSTYTFPIDFMEMKLFKPPFDISQYAGKYFLQVIFKQMKSDS